MVVPVPALLRKMPVLWTCSAPTTTEPSRMTLSPLASKVPAFSITEAWPESIMPSVQFTVPLFWSVRPPRQLHRRRRS